MPLTPRNKSTSDYLQKKNCVRRTEQQQVDWNLEALLHRVEQMEFQNKKKNADWKTLKKIQEVNTRFKHNKKMDKSQ